MGRQTSQSTNTIDQTQSTSFAPATAEEEALRQQFASLGNDQRSAIQNLLQQSQGSAFAMSDADRAQFDRSFDSARQQLETGMRDFADFTAGGRGLRMSDSPIAAQTLQRYGLGLAELESQRAAQGLNLGLAGNQFRTNLGLQAAQALPSGSVAAFNPLFSQRMASGTTRTTGTGFTTGSTTQPIMQSILQGTQAFNQLGQGLQRFGSGSMSSGLGLFGN